MGKPSAPSADPRIGEAAMASAQTGQDYLAMMKSQAAIANSWASQDRTYAMNTFRPMEEQYVKDAQNWASPERTQQAIDQSRASVTANMGAAQGASERAMSSMGVAPGSGRNHAANRSIALNTGLAMAGAENGARANVQAQGDARLANAINMGNGLAVNPGTSLGLASGAISSGFNGAMQGQQQQMSGLNTMQAQKMDAYNAQSSASSSLWGGVGSVVGLAASNPAAFAFLSDETKKEKIKAPGRSLLDAVDAMPVKDWTYKKGEGDGQRHIGTMSQDFKKATGMGDGRSINVIDALGVTMGAVQELSAKITQLNRAPKSRSLELEAA